MFHVLKEVNYFRKKIHDKLSKRLQHCLIVMQWTALYNRKQSIRILSWRRVKARIHHFATQHDEFDTAVLSG